MLFKHIFKLGNVLENIKMQVIFKMIQLVIKQISPELKAQIITALKEWKVKAAESSNPWDDLIVDFLLFLIGAE